MKQKQPSAVKRILSIRGMGGGRITGELMAEEATQSEILTLATQFENKFTVAAAEEE